MWPICTELCVRLGLGPDNLTLTIHYSVKKYCIVRYRQSSCLSLMQLLFFKTLVKLPITFTSSLSRLQYKVSLAYPKTKLSTKDNSTDNDWKKKKAIKMTNLKCLQCMQIAKCKFQNA